MKYIVMECRPSYAIVLDEEGRFLRTANLRYEVGQTVEHVVLMREQKALPVRLRVLAGAAGAAAACLALTLGAGYYQTYVRTYSHIYMSINPDVQMDLNRQGTVVRLTGINEDGKALLEGYDSKGKDKVTVADELIDRAIEMGFLSEGGQVSFSIDSPDDALFQEYGTELRTKVTEHLDGRITITIEIVNHKDGRGQESPESSLSPVPSLPAASQPASTLPSSPEPSRPGNVPPASSGSTDYDDTDYDLNDNNSTNYVPPYTSTPPADTDYDPDDEGVTNYTDGNTDYDPSNGTDDDSDDDDDGDSGYDDDNNDDNADDD